MINYSYLDIGWTGGGHPNIDLMNFLFCMIIDLQRGICVNYY